MNKEKKAKETNALVLAFLGDAVYNLKIKQYIVENNVEKAGKLSRMASMLIRASAQAKVFDEIKETLSEDEQNVAGRAKNIHTSNVPKSSNLEEYKKATSLEAVIGYNQLCGNEKRIEEIVKKAKEIL